MCRLGRCDFEVATELSRLDGWPMRFPADASPSPSRTTPHGSGPMWSATPSSQWTCTTHSLPVSRRTPQSTQSSGSRAGGVCSRARTISDFQCAGRIGREGNQRTCLSVVRSLRWRRRSRSFVRARRLGGFTRAFLQRTRERVQFSNEESGDCVWRPVFQGDDLRGWRVDG